MEFWGTVRARVADAYRALRAQTVIVPIGCAKPDPPPPGTEIPIQNPVGYEIQDRSD